MASEENNPKEIPKKKWRYHLLDYFTEIMQYEEILQSLRQSLSQQDNFSIHNIFNNIDNEQKGYITLGDIIQFLSSHSIEFEEKYIRQLIHFYDKNNDFCLNFQEFKVIISNDEINEKKGEENIREELSENVLSIFCDILMQEIELCKKCEEIAKNCGESRHFTIYEAFVEIAEIQEYITEDNLAKFLEENGIKLEGNKIKRIIYRLDKDNDGKISFVEFHDIFFPPYYNVNKKFNEYKYKLDDFNNSNINNKTYNPPKAFNKSCQSIYLEKPSDNIDNNLDFKYGFSDNPRLKYTSSVLNYNYSTYPDVVMNKYKLNKEFNSLKNRKKNDIKKNEETVNHIYIHCHCCNCWCDLCCN